MNQPRSAKWNKKEIISYLVFFIIFYAVLLAWKHDLITRLFSERITGKVIDVSTGAPVEVVMLSSGSLTTYTNYQGQFSFEINRKNIPDVYVNVPYNFEKGSERIACQPVRSGILDQAFYCESSLYPEAFEVAGRVLNDEEAVEFSARKERQDKKRRLWGRSFSESRKAFKSEEDFVSLLMIKEEIEIKIGSEMVGSTVDHRSRLLESYFDLISQKSLAGVAEVAVRRRFVDGSSKDSLEHFAKEEGIWRYLLPLSREEVVVFVAKNEWVLRAKK